MRKSYRKSKKIITATSYLDDQQIYICRQFINFVTSLTNYQKFKTIPTVFFSLPIFLMNFMLKE